MPSRATALRLLVESALTGRVTSPFDDRVRQALETAPSAVVPVDLLTGGLPRGGLTEIYGPPCSGRTSLLISALAARTAAGEASALVDASDSFDPASAETAGVQLQRLLWVRCRNIDQAFRSVDLLIQGGGFGMIALDLAGIPPQVVRYVPLQVWFRLRRTVENTPTIFLVIGQESNAKTCASLVLRLEARAARWRQTSLNAKEVAQHAPGCLLKGGRIHAEMIHSRAKREAGAWMRRDEIFMRAGGDSTDFEMEIAGNEWCSLRSQRDLEGGVGKR